MQPLRLEVSTVPRKLAGRTEQRGSQTGFPTWGAFAFGGVFVAVGTAIALIGMRLIPVNPRDVHAPWWVLTTIGVVFALAGVAVWGMAARQYRSERRRIDAVRQHPDEPALADFAWDPTGFAAPPWSRAAQALAGAGALTLFFSVFNYWAFGTRNPPWVAIAVTVLLDLFLIAVWWEALSRLGRAIKFGGSRIEFTRFPYRTGEPVAVRWSPGQGIQQARKGGFTLRCVEEWYEHRGGGRNRNAHLVQQERWSATWHLDEPRWFARGETVELTFEPPAHAPPTRLSADKPVFWEFEAKLDLPGLDFEEIYLVPVYTDASRTNGRNGDRLNSA